MSWIIDALKNQSNLISSAFVMSYKKQYSSKWT